MSEKNIERSAEGLSALMDGEVSEFELRRVLSEVASDDGLGATWNRYQAVSSIIKRQNVGLGAQWQSPSLVERVRAEIAQEPAVTQTRASGLKTYLRPVASVAVAASVSAMVVLGWQSYQTVQPGSAVATSVSTNPVVAQTGSTTGQPLMRVSQGTSNSMQVPSAEIIRLDPAAQQRLNDYLMSHSGNAALSTATGLTPYVHSVPAGTDSTLMKVKVEQ